MLCNKRINCAASQGTVLQSSINPLIRISCYLAGIMPRRCHMVQVPWSLVICWELLIYTNSCHEMNLILKKVQMVRCQEALNIHPDKWHVLNSSVLWQEADNDPQEFHRSDRNGHHLGVRASLCKIFNTKGVCHFIHRRVGNSLSHLTLPLDFLPSIPHRGRVPSEMALDSGTDSHYHQRTF